MTDPLTKSERPTRSRVSGLSAGLACLVISTVLGNSNLMHKAHAQTTPNSYPNQIADTFSLPIADPINLLGLAEKLKPGSVLTDLVSCLGLTKKYCTRLDARLIPSTRAIAAVRDCKKLTSANNEFALRDLDQAMRNDVLEVAKSPPSKLTGLVLHGEVEPYDFERQGFSVKWFNPVRVYAPFSHKCGDQKIQDMDKKFGWSFNIAVDPSVLPKFISVAPDKARAWTESGPEQLMPAITVDVQLADFEIAREGGSQGFYQSEDFYGWFFWGPSAAISMRMTRGMSVALEELPLESPKPDTVAAPITPRPPVTFKIGDTRVIASDVNVRTTPSKSAQLAAVLTANQFVTIRQKSVDGLWSYAEVDGVPIGWILDSALLRNSKTNGEIVATEGANDNEIAPPDSNSFKKPEAERQKIALQSPVAPRKTGLAAVAASRTPPSNPSELREWKRLYDRDIGKDTKNWTGLNLKVFRPNSNNVAGLPKMFSGSDWGGFEVVSVAAGSPAERAGIRPSDIVIVFKGCACEEIVNGNRVRVLNNSMHHFYAALLSSERRNKEPITAVYIRRGSPDTYDAVLHR